MKMRNFNLMTMARIYAWYLRKRGYEITIGEWVDQFPSGWLLASGYEVVGVKIGE